MHAAIVFKEFKQGLAKELREFNKEQAHCALGTAIAALGAVLIANWLNLDKPYWAGISALVVSRSSYDASLVKGALRIAGTIGGCIIALILLGTFIDNVFAILCIIFFTSIATVIVSNTRGWDSYAWGMAGFMVVLLSIAGLVIPQSIFNFAFYRTFEISLGTIMAIIMSAIVNPNPPESVKPSKNPAESKMSPTQESELIKQAISLGLAMVSSAAYLEMAGPTGSVTDRSNLADPAPTRPDAIMAKRNSSFAGLHGRRMYRTAFTRQPCRTLSHNLGSGLLGPDFLFFLH